MLAFPINRKLAPPYPRNSTELILTLCLLRRPNSRSSLVLHFTFTHYNSNRQLNALREQLCDDETIPYPAVQFPSQSPAPLMLHPAPGSQFGSQADTNNTNKYNREFTTPYTRRRVHKPHNTSYLDPTNLTPTARPIKHQAERQSHPQKHTHARAHTHRQTETHLQRSS